MLKRLWPLVLAMSAPALADKTVAVTPENLDSLTSLDEVIVQGDPSLSAARIAIDAAEDRFYARWNSLNRDPKFDIRCEQRVPGDHPSRIKFRVCQAAFVDEIARASAQQTMAAIQGAASSEGRTVSLPTSESETQMLNDELRKRTLEMIRKDPALQRALLERARLAQHYEALRKEKFKDRWIVWK